MWIGRFQRGNSTLSNTQLVGVSAACLRNPTKQQQLCCCHSCCSPRRTAALSQISRPPPNKALTKLRHCSCYIHCFFSPKTTRQSAPLPVTAAVSATAVSASKTDKVSIHPFLTNPQKTLSSSLTTGIGSVEVATEPSPHTAGTAVATRTSFPHGLKTVFTEREPLLLTNVASNSIKTGSCSIKTGTSRFYSHSLLRKTTCPVANAGTLRLENQAQKHH